MSNQENNEMFIETSLVTTGRKVMPVRPHLQCICSTFPRPSSSKRSSRKSSFTGESSSVGVHTLQPIVPLDGSVELESISTLAPESTLTFEYPKHSNLDVQPLSFTEWFHLSRLHYCSLSNVLRTLLYLFFIGLLLYTSTTTLSEYFKYRTEANIEYRLANHTQPPAITFCSACLLCAFPNESIIYASEIFSNNRIHSMLDVNGSTDGQPDIDMQCRLSVNTVPETNSEGDVYNCTDIVPVVISYQSGHKCFTFFSDLEGAMSRLRERKDPRALLKIDAQPLIQVHLTGKLLSEPATVSDTSSMSNPLLGMGYWARMRSAHPIKSYWGMYFTLHDPSLLPDMAHLQYYRLQASSYTQVQFTRRIEFLKESPYATHCLHYRRRHLHRRPDEMDVRAITGPASPNPGIYRSRGECVLYCLWRVLNANRCMSLFSVATAELAQQEQYYRLTKYVHKMAQKRANQTRYDSENAGTGKGSHNTDDANLWVKFCQRPNTSYKAVYRIQEQCMEACPRACRVDTYVEDGVINLINTVGDDNNMVEANGALVHVFWASKPITVVQHRPAMDWSDLTGNIAGNVHILLGLSLLAIIRYLIRLARLGKCMPGHTCLCLLSRCRTCKN